MKNKKLLMPIAAVATLGAVAPVMTVTSCKDNTTKVTVVFDYGFETENVEVAEGSTVAKPEDPKYAGMTFTGWYKDKAWTELFDFTTEKITKTTTLYAGWEIQEVKEISINTDKVKMAYTFGDLFSLDGLVVTGTYADGSKGVIPTWACTSDPSEGALLKEHGWFTVTVRVGTCTAKYQIKVMTAVLSISATCDEELQGIYVGKTIYKSEFHVVAKRSDGTESEVSTLLWESNIFPDGALSYTFTESGEKEIIINYGGKQAILDSYAYFDSDYSFNLPLKFVLPINTSEDKGVKFYSHKIVTVLSQDGEPVSTDKLTFTVDEAGANKITVVDGTIHAVGSTNGQYIPITVKEGDKQIGKPIEVQVVNVDNPDIAISSTSRVADYGVYTHDKTLANPVCVIPDSISVNDTTYTLNLVDGEDTELSTIVDLYLPKNLYSIEQYSTSTGNNIQNIYFDGKEDDYSAVEKTSLWSNKFVTGVQCIDNFVKIDKKSDKAGLSYDETYSKFIMATDPFVESTWGSTLQFDLRQMWTSVSSFTPIQLMNYEDDGTPEIYANGTKLDAGTDFTWGKAEGSTTNDLITFNNDKIVGKNVVIKAPGRFLQGGYAITVSNILPTEIRVDNYRRTWHVGEQFNKTVLEASWVFADGSTVKIDKENFTVDSAELSSGEKISFGYKFKEGDKGTIEVTLSTDLLPDIKTTFTIIVKD